MCIATNQQHANEVDGLSGLFAIPTDPTLRQVVPAPPRRRKFREIKSRYHCPIIGTCLTVEELRKLARRAGLDGWDTASDYELHSTAVGFGQEKNALSELIQKELERKFEPVVKRFMRAKSEDGILSLWRTALAQGEVAAALWAVMSHGRTTEKLAHIAYEDVHMLSHQVGAASRADLRKNARLALANDEMTARLARQQDRFAQQLSEKDEIISALNARLANAESAEKRLLDIGGGKAEMAQSLELGRQRQRIAELEWRLNAESANAVKSEKKLREAGERANRLEQVVAELRQQLETAEATLGNLLQPPACGNCEDGREGRCAGPGFSGRCVLCVGGRTGMADHYRLLVERRNGRFVHHDGGLEDNPKRLQVLLAAADAVICPADNVSHGAYYVVKRLCKQYGKPCVLLKNSGLSSFARGLDTLDEAGSGAALALI